MAVGQETVIANALETRGQGVLQEKADELLGRDSHHLGIISARRATKYEQDEYYRSQTAE
jgi:hypothetical protein